MSAEPSSEFNGASGNAFFTYPSFNSIEKGVANVERLAPEVCKSAVWCATEKIHGSNFSVTFGENENEPKYGSRSGYLSKSFFNHIEVMKPYMPAITAMVEELRAEKPGVRVQTFGEIYGGAVQTVNVVFYKPTPDFKAFDVFVAGEPLHRDVMFALFEKHGVPFVKPRARGLLAELLAMDPAFESEIYMTHGLPKPEKSNKAEGMVRHRARSCCRVGCKPGGQLLTRLGSVLVLCECRFYSR
jgi:Rnl2 family RNA ligase